MECNSAADGASLLTSGGFSSILRQLLSSVGELFSSELLLLVDEPLLM